MSSTLTDFPKMRGVVLLSVSCLILPVAASGQEESRNPRDTAAAVDREIPELVFETDSDRNEYLVGSLLVVLLLLLSLYWNQRLSREVRKTRSVEQTLSETQERQNYALEAAEEGIWDHNLGRDETVFSHRYWEMLGYDPALRKDARMSDVFELVHPSDRERVKNAFPAVFDRETDASGIEIRIRSTDG